MRSSIRLACLANALVLGCHGLDGESSAVDVAPLASGQRTMQFVAHQDDDIIFMNPDISESYDSGNVVRTVYITAGNLWPINAAYVDARENGILVAYAKMANEDITVGQITTKYTQSFWQPSPGCAAAVYTLNSSAGRLSLSFMRLEAAQGALLPLTTRWDSGVMPDGGIAIGTVKQINAQSFTYTKGQLTSCLQAMLQSFAPAVVRIQDSSAAWRVDHEDHVAAGRFVAKAFADYRQAAPTARLLFYRGDNVLHGDGYVEPVNVNAADLVRKQAILDKYCPNDPVTSGVGCYHSDWAPRRYAASAYPGARYGRLANGLFSCVNSSLALVNCASAPLFKLTAEGRLQSPPDTNSCIRAAGVNGLTMGACDATALRWYWTSDGLLLNDDGRLLDGTNGVSATRFMAVPGEASPTSVTPHLVTPEFRWSFLTDNALQWSSAFSNAAGWGDTTTAFFASLRAGDVNGDGLADVCGRGNGGVQCALNVGGGFATPTQWSSAFTGAGYSANGLTLMLGDLNADGRADACMRSTSGIDCVNSTGSAFAATATRRSAGTDFSDAQGWANEATYGALRLADVNGDGKLDVCGRRSNGIWCAAGLGTGAFATATLRVGSYLDASGWSLPQQATTIQFGDLDGDGRADVCGREGDAGMVCGLAKSDGTFRQPTQWSPLNRFSNNEGWALLPAYYQSIRLADVDGDGLADVCGRGYSGLECARSTGSTFGANLLLTSPDFSNAQGWSEDRYGTTMMYGKFNADGRLDVCGRGAGGLMCVGN